MHPLVLHLKQWAMAHLQSGGYPLLVLLMAMESSIVPLPSETVIPPAAHIAVTTHTMSLPGIVLAGTLGCWVGASAMYWASRLIGRPILMKFVANYGHFILITTAKVEQTERWLLRLGDFGVFASRMIPVVRHLIGIPAGMARMPFPEYSLYTVLGSVIWCTVLAWVGVLAGKNQALVNGDMTTVTIWAVGALCLLGAIYYFCVHRLVRKKG